MVFKSKKASLKLVIKPGKTPRDPNAVYAKFVDCVYETTDKEIIDYIKKHYMNEVTEGKKEAKK